ncbi:MAG: HAMP domain-containing protein [Planctomycetes bacterium]|nr:HAMP domain-containing protein [Planctomycetota bacterium]
MRDPLGRVSIRWKLPLAFLAVGTIALGVGGGLVHLAVRERLRGRIEHELDLVARDRARLVGAYLCELAGRTRDFASDGYIRDQAEAVAAGADPSPLCDHLARNKTPLVPGLLETLVAAPGGELLASSLGPSGPPLADLVTGVHLAGPGASLRVAVPLTGRTDGRPLGWLVNRVAEDWFPRLLVSDPLPPLGLSTLGVSLEPGGPSREPGGRAEGDRLAARVGVPDSPWAVRVTVDAVEALAPLARLRAELVAVGAIVVLLATAVCAFPIRFLVGPLERLREAAERLGRDERDVRVSVESEDEIGVLARSFNRMADSLRERATALEATAAARAQEKDRLDALIGSMGDALVFVDEAGTVALCNEAARRLGGPRVAVGLPIVESHSPEVHPRVLAELAALRVHGSGACRRTLAAGERSYDVSLTPVRDARGAYLGTVFAARDITDRLRMEERLAQRGRDALVAQMAASLAHEINNPLAAIVLFARMIAEDAPEGSALGEHAAVIARNARSCERAVLGLMDLARPAGPAPEGRPRAGPWDVARAVEEAALVCGPLAARSGVRIQTEVAPGVPPRTADGAQMQQVLVNLVVNAIQAQPRGGRVVIAAAGGEGGGLRVSVRDEGPGVSLEVEPRLFEPFYTTKPRGEGTGLGLAISRRIVEAHGGTLRLEREGGPGATFAVQLPPEGVA